MTEQADQNYAAYMPDLSGCVVTSATLAEVEHEMAEAIQFHLDGLREDRIVSLAPGSGVVGIDA